jgi:hypothetical protein
MAPAKMKLFTLALGALGLAGLSVGQEGPTSIVVMTEISTLPESTAVTQPATRVGRGDPVAKDTPPPRGGITIVHTMPCASPPCAAVETETPPPRGSTTVVHTMPCASTPCAAITPAPTSFPYTTYTTCNINFPPSHTCKVTTESCGGESTLSTETQYRPDRGDWYTETIPCPKIITTTVTTCYSSGYTPVPLTECPAGTCGPACRPDVHCRKKVKFGREALPTSQDLGGRSQRAVAREAKTTSSWIWPTKPATTTTSFNCPKCSDGPLPTTTPLFETAHTAGTFPRCTFVDGQYICPTPKAEREAPRTTDDLGGRSQRAVAIEAIPTSRRWVAREAKPTVTQPYHGGVCFTGTPLRPTAPWPTFTIGPLPVPTDQMPPNFSIPKQSDPWTEVKPTARPTVTKPHYSILPIIKLSSANASTLVTVARKA